MSKFDELINGDLPILVDFSAKWCGPCKAMSPILQRIVPTFKGKAKIIKVEIDKNPAATQKYNVRGVPTFILFKNGTIKWRQSRMVDAQQLINVINQYSL